MLIPLFRGPTEGACSISVSAMRNWIFLRQYHSLQAIRDMFNRLLIIGKRRDIDLEELLSYTIIPVPMSLGTTDGTPCKTVKAKLMHGCWSPCSGDLRKEPARFRSLLWALDRGLEPSTHPPSGTPMRGSNTLGSCPWMTLSSLNVSQYSVQFQMKQSGH